LGASSHSLRERREEPGSSEPPGTTHAGSELGLRTFVDHDAALTVVVVAALTNILGEIPCQLGGKTHASLYKTLRIFYAGFS
jgi:hypothetical protein